MQQLKPLHEQVIVLMGASSGIGRATAEEAVARGATVVVAARDKAALDDFVALGEQSGALVMAVEGDVSDYAQVERVAEQAVARYGRIDTWVNVAGVSVYGTYDQVPLDEVRRIMDVNFMGQVHGALAALPHLQREGRGALICVGSVAGARAIPFQSAYSASKHALKGWLESIRVELEMQESGVQVTLVKPSSINTPFFDEARTHMGRQPAPVPPTYQPSVAAKAILHCAEHREREITVGGGGRLIETVETFAAGLLDRYFAKTPGSQSTDEPKSEHAPANLESPIPGVHAAEGHFPARSFSVYTTLRTRPRLALGLGAALGAAGLTRVMRRRAVSRRVMRRRSDHARHNERARAG